MRVNVIIVVNLARSYSRLFAAFVDVSSDSPGSVNRAMSIHDPRPLLIIRLSTGRRSAKPDAVFEKPEFICAKVGIIGPTAESIRRLVSRRELVPGRRVIVRRPV